ncbi:MAG: hypothetical protein C5B50_05805 [Verrucomicrobia bacterium]|nr:MAG: hypothetical protein C5B50_05805 [Verrucomicrobiota bacterium]
MSFFPATLLSLLFSAGFACAETFRVATYNVESYLDAPTQSRPAKSAEAKAQVRDNILALKPDVLALQEMGTVTALMELQDSLKRGGLQLPFWDHISGADTNIHLAILSRFPFNVRTPHTNDNFLLSGRRFRVSRGFAELDIQVTANFSFTLIAAHLKSRRPSPVADESEERLEEAKLLRLHIDQRLNTALATRLIVLGDFNDTKDSAPIRAVIGRGKQKLLDTRPAERNGDPFPGASSSREGRNVTWTHYYSKDDTYSRIDYILVSSDMARQWVTNETWVLAAPNWGVASDHRPIVATFETGSDQ